MKDKLIINRADIPFNINSDDTVIKTDLGTYSKITRMTTYSSNHNPVIVKKSKYEYYDKRDDTTKQYNLDKPVSIKDAKKKLRKYQELVLNNFKGGRSELFITLTCAENIQDFNVIKQYSRKFINKLKSQDKYKSLEYIGQYEQTKLGRWHIHLFAKYPNNKILTIPYTELLSLWGYGNVHIIQNLNTLQILGHSSTKRDEKLERLTNFPKNERMYFRSQGIKTPVKTRLKFKECPEYNSSNYKQISRKSYTIENKDTNQYVNTITTAMYKNISQTADTSSVKDNEITSTIKEHSPYF